MPTIQTSKDHQDHELLEQAVSTDSLVTVLYQTIMYTWTLIKFVSPLIIYVTLYPYGRCPVLMVWLRTLTIALEWPSVETSSTDLTISMMTRWVQNQHDFSTYKLKASTSLLTSPPLRDARPLMSLSSSCAVEFSRIRTTRLVLSYKCILHVIVCGPCVVLMPSVFGLVALWILYVQCTSVQRSVYPDGYTCAVTTSTMCTYLHYCIQCC